MNILFDQTDAQALFYNGAAEYAQTVFFKMLNSLESYPDVSIYCLYHSDKKFRYERLSCENFKSCERVIPVDYKGKSLKAIIQENSIDLLFITCIQSFCDLPLGAFDHLPCKVVCVIHDLCDEEMALSRILLFQHMSQPKKMLRYYLSRAKVRLLSFNINGRQKIMYSMLMSNDVDIVTVSDYSRRSLKYNYPSLRNKIHVLAAPQKEAVDVEPEIKNGVLADIVAKKQQYLLLLSADRILKNAGRMIRAFEQYVKQTGSDCKLVTVGYSQQEYSSHVSLPFLSTSDLEHAYRNCHALLYPSLFEGFGYPPLEAMKYGKPVLCSYVCSMPEVLESAPIYYSPIYETDMFYALDKFFAFPYDELSKRSLRQYEKVSKKQAEDLQYLVDALMCGTFI